MASFQALWAVTDWDQTSENREGDPIVLDNRSFVWLRGPTSGGGDKLDSSSVLLDFALPMWVNRRKFL